MSSRREAVHEAEENMVYTADNTFDNGQGIDSLFASADVTQAVTGLVSPGACCL